MSNGFGKPFYAVVTLSAAGFSRDEVCWSNYPITIGRTVHWSSFAATSKVRLTIRPDLGIRMKARASKSLWSNGRNRAFCLNTLYLFNESTYLWTNPSGATVCVTFDTRERYITRHPLWTQKNYRSATVFWHNCINTRGYGNSSNRPVIRFKVEGSNTLFFLTDQHYVIELLFENDLVVRCLQNVCIC